MITGNDQEDTPGNWYYLALKREITDDGFKKPTRSVSKLFRGITSSINRDYYCPGCFHSFRTYNALKKHERLCDNHDYREIVLPTKDKNTEIQSWRKIIKSCTYILS